MDRTFEAHCLQDVIDIDRWEDAPLDYATNYFPFICYNEDTGIFECWSFNAWPIMGYYSDSKVDIEDADYKLVADEPDVGITIINPYEEDEYRVIFTPYAKDDIEEKIIELNQDDEYKKCLQLVAYRLFPEDYLKGNIMTTYDAVKYFCKDMET